MTWLALAYLLSVGTLNYNEGAASNAYSPITQYPSNTYQTTLGIEAQLLDNHIFIGGSVETWESSLNNGLFAPWESLYIINAGIRFSNIELGYRHECDHATITGETPIYGFLENKDEIYFTYKHVAKIF
jgi:hypothetical protein